MPQHRRIGAAAQQRRRRLQPPVAGQRIAITALQAHLATQQQAQHVVRPPHRLLRATRLQPAPGLRLAVDPAAELHQQARLAHARLADHGQALQAWLLRRAQLRKGLLQLFKLGLAPDHARLQALHAALGHAAGRKLNPLHQVAVDRLVVALDQQRRLLQQAEATSHLPIGVLADAHRPRGRGLLHPRRHVDGHAADAVVAVDATAEQHLPGVDAHPQAEVGVAMSRQHVLRHRATGLQNGQPRQHGALGIVLVRHWRAKHRQQTVAGVLQDPALVLLDDRGEAFQRPVHHRADFFRVQMLTQSGRADDVGEQHRDQPELLAAGLTL